MQCNRCGGQAPDGAAFCPFCGEVLNFHNAVPPVMNTDVYNTPPVYYPPQKKNNTWMLVVGIVFIVLINIGGFLFGRILPYLINDEIIGSFDELSSPENVAQAYLNHLFMADISDYDEFNYHTTIDWDSVFADKYAIDNNLPESDYDVSHDYAKEVFEGYCSTVIPDVEEIEIVIDSVTEQPYTIIHKYINIFDNYFRPHGLSSVDYISYSDIHRIHEVSLTVTFINELGETSTIPVIVNVAEFDGFYDVITDSLFTDGFIVYALSENEQSEI